MIRKTVSASSSPSVWGIYVEAGLALHAGVPVICELSWTNLKSRIGG